MAIQKETHFQANEVMRWHTGGSSIFKRLLVPWSLEGSFVFTACSCLLSLLTHGGVHNTWKGGPHAPSAASRLHPERNKALY